MSSLKMADTSPVHLVYWGRDLQFRHEPLLVDNEPEVGALAKQRITGVGGHFERNLLAVNLGHLCCGSHLVAHFRGSEM